MHNRYIHPSERDTSPRGPEHRWDSPATSALLWVAVIQWNQCPDPAKQYDALAFSMSRPVTGTCEENLSVIDTRHTWVWCICPLPYKCNVSESNHHRFLYLQSWNLLCSTTCVESCLIWMRQDSTRQSKSCWNKWSQWQANTYQVYPSMISLLTSQGGRMTTIHLGPYTLYFISVGTLVKYTSRGNVP